MNGEEKEKRALAYLEKIGQSRNRKSLRSSDEAYAQVEQVRKMRGLDTNEGEGEDHEN